MSTEEHQRVISLWTVADSEKALNELASTFKENPRRFFTEHDLHSHLYNLVEAELSRKGELFVQSKDEQKISLVHHEYPTPFRCDMSKKGFKISEELERTTKGGLYRRGHYDLVVLNPDFIRKYNAVVVAGKNYYLFCEERGKINVAPIQWVCELIFGAHVENNLPLGWENIVFQDAKKILASLSYSVGKANFALSGSVIVFIGAKADENINHVVEKIQEFSVEHNFPIKVYTA